MAEERIKEDEEEGAEPDDGKTRSFDSGCNTSSKYRAKETISDWLSRKEKDRVRKLGEIHSRRIRSGNHKPINKVSKKQKKKNSDYAKAKTSFFSVDDNRKCELCGCISNLSIHHKNKRLDGNISDINSFSTLCIIGNYMDVRYPDSNHSHSGGCHGWIEGNKAWARENGYLD